MPWAKVPRICEQCGADFMASRRSDGVTNRFCSHRCSELSTSTKVSLTCRQCSEQFIGKPYRLFCSRPCADKYRNENSSAITYNCQACGKAYTRKASKPGTAFCSRNCQNSFRTVQLICAHCGKTFSTKESHAARRRFCSWVCRKSHSGESGDEIKVRLALQAMGVVFVQEHRIFRYAIDFYLTDYNVALEVDGVYWHAREVEKDHRRDKYLARIGIPTVRITDKELDRCADVQALIQSRLAPFNVSVKPRYEQVCMLGDLFSVPDAGPRPS